ncbi:hypothetical protein BDV96DRAFT_508514 [Lophiotrema nucula]|uniref:P-loop containing nucleoside triphosphate hydrolase protein n=1 Tax=Lophiotrema nucula TaxID=690887 RepID=A0A6A5YFX6_9PLEO|nr:hypothetical protein BDV96DRAFT_508514 [Lophiotrema nucula]
MAPLVWWNVKQELSKNGLETGLEQYAVFGQVLSKKNNTVRKPVLLNTNAPWSAFLCGSQGSGKSHALSCMLENCLLQNEAIGKNPKPLAGLVFHYDNCQSSGVCEAAYLCTKVPTTVLVSPSYYGELKKQYENMAQQYGGKITVEKLQLRSEHLNIDRMKTLMAVGKENDMPLYMQVIFKILRDMAVANGGTGRFSYRDFKTKLQAKQFLDKQTGPLTMRIDLLESFLHNSVTKSLFNSQSGPNILCSEPGTLTIVDLTDPLVDVDFACALFNICLSIFISQTQTQTKCGKIVALDEAHKYMNNASAGVSDFTDRLLTTIREQRHVGTRVVIATQEPGINEALLDLCSITMVHRCTSPAWFAVLKKHIAGLYLGSGNEGDVEGSSHDKATLEQIVRLKLGESLLFCAGAAVDMVDGKVVKMAQGRVRFRTRERLTADGGKTKLADGV